MSFLIKNKITNENIDIDKNIAIDDMSLEELKASIKEKYIKYLYNFFC